jgi:F0F1-type ATP synthase membrane subunit b/b'
MPFSPTVLLAGVVDLDATFLIQWGIFLLFFFIVRGWVWKPFMEILERRDHEINGLRVEADRSEKEAKLREQTYQEKYREAQNSAVERRQALLDKEQKASVQVVEGARAAAAKTTAESKMSIEQQAQESLLRMRAESTENAKAICEQILGRKVTS